MEATLTRSEVARTETLRLEALEKYEVLGAPPDPAVEDLVELAARTCQHPHRRHLLRAVADRILLHSRFGLTETELPRNALPGVPSLRTQSVFEIPDSRHHPACPPGGIVLGGRTYRFYAGAPAHHALRHPHRLALRP